MYRWYWGDGTANNTRAGYDNGRNLSHTYASAGTYTLIVTVTNKAGSARVEKDITVLGNLFVFLNNFYYVVTFHSDPLYSVTINGPKHFAAYTTVTYSCVVQSLNGTEYYTPVTYQWSFSDGYVASGTSVSRHYTQAASLIITCTATNPISVKSNSTQVLVVESKYQSSLLKTSIHTDCSITQDSNTGVLGFLSLQNHQKDRPSFLQMVLVKYRNPKPFCWKFLNFLFN